MKLSEKYNVHDIGMHIIDIAKETILESSFREVISIGGPQDIVAKADSVIEDNVAEYITQKDIPINLDGEERRRRKLCFNPLGLLTFDPIDGTDNFVDDTLHYCTIATFFDSPEPKTLGEAVWSGIYDHVSKRMAYFNDHKTAFIKYDKEQKPKSRRIESISEIGDGYLKLYLDLGPRERSSWLEKYDGILAISWRKNISCAGFHFMEIAFGSRDAAILPVQKPEELVAGIPLIEANGGAVLTFEGKRAGDLPYNFDKRYQIVAATSPKLAKELVEMIK